MYHHDKSIIHEVLHTIKNLYVDAINLPASGNFNHPDFGEMIDTTSIMTVGSYVFITFILVLHERDDSFDLQILGGQTMEESQENVRRNEETKQFLNDIHEVIAIEHDKNKESETAAWEAIGLFVLKGYNDKEVTSGLRPVMELMDKSKLLLFLKRKETAPIVMIKQKEMDGVWVDDDDENRGQPQYGSLFPRIKVDATKKKRPISGKPQKAQENVDDVRFDFGQKLLHKANF
ncbi:hypothetical protein GCK72_022890 [Caenorhabditis remanei]|uniref:Uncharacterized protein n=1 Tax=Caenorhabditis remanei TaxID=31234 RepID=A0A6A5FV70_CAERE|nr:hypothetical protein GCK72_022890 [Caenorhabditis remanei]KAF1746434.1 hypothetical protein GCK72_022890 [Caenorhabditis remanei]